MRFLTRCAAVAAMAVLALSSQAQTFPSKTVRIVVPFGAGGVAELTARTVAERLSQSLGQAVVIDNKPGAGGVAAGDLVASSWNALAAPAKTPAAIIARLNKDIAAAVNAPDVKAKLRALNMDAQASTPEQTAQLLASETKRWGDVIVRAKIPTL